MKNILIFIVLAALVVAGYLYFSPSTSVGPQESMTPAPSTSAVVSSTPTRTPTPSTSPKVTGRTVIIQNFAFNPASVTVNQGDTVVFKNMDSTVHTATALDGSFDTHQIAVGGSFTVQTATMAKGIHQYHCSIHPSMAGTLIVQ